MIGSTNGMLRHVYFITLIKQEHIMYDSVNVHINNGTPLLSLGNVRSSDNCPSICEYVTVVWPDGRNAPSVETDASCKSPGFLKDRKCQLGAWTFPSLTADPARFFPLFVG